MTDTLISKTKIFMISFLACFSMVIIQHLGVHTLSIVNPLPKKVPLLNQLTPKLQQNPNFFQLKTNPTTSNQLPATSNQLTQASAYGVIDLDSGQVITAKNLNQPLPIASLTKIMTAIVALDLSQPADQFMVTDNAAQTIPTKIGVVPGQKMTLEELLNAALLTSANDAVAVIQDGVNNEYNNNIFVQAMNAKAAYLGLKNSHFTNPQGFDDSNHHSSVADLAVLTHYALNNYPLISQIVKKSYQFLPSDSNHKQFDLYNWNGLLGVYPGVYGVKIGNTTQAADTTIVASTRQGKNILAILLGVPGVLERDLGASELLDLGFAKTINLPPVALTSAQLEDKYHTWKYFN